MKKPNTAFTKRLMSLLLAVALLIVVAIPTTQVTASAAPATALRSPLMFWGGMLVKSLPLVFKMNKSLQYAYNEQMNSGYSIVEKNVFWSSFSAYNYGNAAVGKVEDLNKVMQREFSSVHSEIASISQSIAQLQNNIQSMIDSKANEELITKFKIDYIDKLQELQNSYNGMQACMESNLSTAEDFKKAFDQLYSSAKGFSGLQAFLTGEYSVNGKNIMQVYREYMLQNIPERADELTEAFVMDLYTSDMLYRYCMELCYVYQMGYMTAMGKDRYTLVGENYTLYLSYFTTYIEKLIDGQKNVSANCINILTDVVGSKRICAYITEDGSTYALNLAETTEAHTGAKYALAGLGSAYAEMFTGAVTYSSSDRNLATVTETGVVHVRGSHGSFTISCNYEGIEVYSLEFVIAKPQMSGGYGQENAPYRIATLSEYKEFMETYGSDSQAYGQLIADIDFANTGYTLGTFQATLDGNGHTLSNISSRDASLVCYINNGTIKNLRISDSSIEYSNTRTNATVGTFAGTNRGYIHNCIAEKVKISASVSELNYSTISIRAGGIAGCNESGTITHCVAKECDVRAASTGNITTGVKDPGDTLYSYAYAGGIAGTNISNGVIEDCLCVNPSAISANASSGAYCFKYGWPFVSKHYDREGHAYAYAAGIVGQSSGGTIRHSIYHSASGTDVISVSTSNLGTYDNNYESHHKNCKNIQVVQSSAKKDLFDGSASVESSNYRTTDLTLANMSETAKAELTSCGWNISKNTISVAAPEQIVVSEKPLRTIYVVGETFNVAGLKITKADKTQVVGYTISVSTSKAGKTMVLVTKDGQSTEFEITVNEETCQIHTWDSGVVKKYASCTVQGETLFTCKVCGATKTETTPMLAHAFGSWEKLDNQTHQRKCSNCIAVEKRNHFFSNNACTDCGAVKQGNIYSETGAQIVVSGVSCSKNTTSIKVPIRIDSNPGVVSVQLTVSYDEQVMKLVGVEDGGILGSALHSDNYTNGYKLTWANDTITENITANGIIATLTFELLPNVSEGEYQVSVLYDYSNCDIMNVDMDPVAFEVKDGKISITETVIGDVNGDGQVNTKDRMILARCLAGWAGYSMDEINKLGADVDGDGNVNTKDRIILSRYLAGWPEYSSLPYNGN